MVVEKYVVDVVTFAIAEQTAISYRKAVSDDVPALVAMLRAFVTSTKYRKFVGDSPDALKTFLSPLIDNQSAAIFVAEQDGAVIGMLGVLGYVHPMSGEKCAGELFWWLNPEHRGAGGWLLRRAESWARAFGAVSIQMIAPSDKPDVERMYRRVGYEPVEIAYHKRLS